jgi:hypothetical protein
MWFFPVIIFAIVVGIVMSIAGAGFIGIPLLIIAALVAVAKLAGNARRGEGARQGSAAMPASGNAMSSTGGIGAAAEGGPQDTEHRPADERETGFAHRGQEHMTG